MTEADQRLNLKHSNTDDITTTRIETTCPWLKASFQSYESYESNTLLLPTNSHISCISSEACDLNLWFKISMKRVE